MIDWLSWKREIVAATNLDRDALHIYAAVAVQIAAALIARRKLGDWLPWLAAAAVAFANEAADIWFEYWPTEHALQAAKALHDLVNTMILPTALLLLSRWRPDLAGRS